MIRPPQSLDINPIKLMWERLDRNMHKISSTSAIDFWNILQEQRTDIPHQMLQKLRNRMSRIAQVLFRARREFSDEQKI